MQHEKRQPTTYSGYPFLYKQVLGIDLLWLDGITRAKPSKRLPTVLTQAETRALLAEVDGLPGLVIKLLYGTGMRLMEGLRLRVKDIDFAGRAIVVRGGKGDKDRVVPLPEFVSLSLAQVLVALGLYCPWLPEGKSHISRCYLYVYPPWPRPL